MSRYANILVAAALVAVAIPTGAEATPIDSAGRFQKAPAGKIGTTFTPRTVTSAKPVDVIVELSGDPVSVVQARTQRQLSSTERAAIRGALKSAQGRVASSISAKGGHVLTTMQSAINGMRVRISSKQLNAISQLPGVKAVHAVPRHTVDNATSVPFLGVPAVWNNTGRTGAGVKVAVIDTGIDYTHADFGGPGTVEAYTEAHANEATDPDPDWVGPEAPRVKGGYDFVGDAYNADDATPVIKPDNNPLDCNGHGTHVAGTAAGSGVLSDGTTYPGPYNSATPAASFKVGPGVAPQADLYALRVFGCEGSTDVTTEAIDWAVLHQMDVVNMSLGSSFGQADDADAIAATNAVGAGVVVVVSAGNSGPNPYLVGAPASAHGVVAVAAVDTNASFPGADLQFDGGTAHTINANGGNLPAGPYQIVALVDNPATPDVNESFGCSVSDFTDVGIAAGDPLQIAVVNRGSCARVAKAIFGQQAGADAVLMVNSSSDFPPYEGRIGRNPDDGVAYDVTIPFLGVPSGTSVPDGASATLSSSTLQNPGFKSLAPFSSGGPRSGDSGLAPSVSAPGVSITSASSGSGSEPETLSGTSMAAPHVAGVAALAVQAHPTWSAADVSSVLISTADPTKVNSSALALGGTGLVNAAKAVATKVIATGDSYTTKSGHKHEATLSFGLTEPSSSYSGSRTITLTNKGSKSVTYKVKVQKASGSVSATVSVSRTKVKVKAHKTAHVTVKIKLTASKIGSSMATDQDPWRFRAVSGRIQLTATGSTLRLPYLLVGRAQAKVAARLTTPNPWLYGPTPSVLTSATVKLTNPKGAISADADVYAWGLSDPADVAKEVRNRGFDLRAAGVQSLDSSDGKLLVFAVNNHTKESNAAANEFDVNIDTNADGDADYTVFSADSGAVRAGAPDGRAEVFIYNTLTKGISSSGYFASAPTDSSTVLLPVEAGALGLTEVAGDFAYTVSSYSQQGPWSDEMTGTAKYNPFTPAIGNAYLPVPRNATRYVTVTIDPTAQAVQRPRGLMVVVFDNKSGSSEAILLGA